MDGLSPILAIGVSYVIVGWICWKAGYKACAKRRLRPGQYVVLGKKRLYRMERNGSLRVIGNIDV